MRKEYRLSAYQDYGPLETKEQVHLLRNKITGKICVKKTLSKEQQEIVQFRVNNQSSWFPQVMEVIEEKEQLIVVEEYIEGVNLEEYLMGTPLEENAAAEIACQICEALGMLHRESPMIVYRDLKAENVMITPQQTIKLVDFDISRTYQEGKKRDTRLLGTAEYAAPEQFGYFQTDNRTDIYAFGVLFNYMLTGKFPIECITEGTYGEVIQKCIELDPDRRYQNVEEILKVIDSKRVVSVRIEKEEIKTEKIETWALPGFRSGKRWKMLCAVLGYGLLLYMGLTIEFTEKNGVAFPLKKMWINRICFLMSQMMTIMLNFDYRGVLKKTSVIKNCPKILRMFLFVISWFVFLVVGVLLASVVEILLGV